MPKRKKYNTVAALAGRRVDAEDAGLSRFPLDRTSIVKTRLAELFRRENVELLVCSAACGADLLALDAALESGIRCQVILPFEKSRFRQTSVVDRPGNWGELFDRIVSLIEVRGDLRILPEDALDVRAYQLANDAIIEQVATTPATRRLAIIVWEELPRDQDDLTEQFRRIAATAGLVEQTISTTCD